MKYLYTGLLNYIILFPFFLSMEVLIYKYYKHIGIQLPKAHLLGWQLLACIIVIILFITGPADIVDIIKDSTIQIGSYAFQLNISFTNIQQVLNIVLFIPLGFVLPLLWKTRGRFILSIMSGFLLSLLIEIFQLFNFRAPDINDLFMNTLGATIGSLSCLVFFFWLSKFYTTKKKSQWHARLGSISSVLLIFLFYILIGSPILTFLEHRFTA